jgi:hypothetical protein
MASKLSIYQGAVLVCEERKLASLTESRESRRMLDGVWDRNGVRTCLQLGQWNHATRVARVEHDPSLTQPFGFRYGFAKPDDFVRTVGVCHDEYYQSPLLSYEDKASHWWADITPLYVQFVSSSNDYGMDFSKWPPNFERLVEHYFALQIVGRLTSNRQLKADVKAGYDYWLLQAKNTDAMEQPAKFPPRGSWASARGGRGGGRDGGSRGSLIG